MKNIKLFVIIQDSVLSEILDKKAIMSFLPTKLQDLIELYKFNQEDSATSSFVSCIEMLFQKKVFEKSVIPVIISSEYIYNIDKPEDALKLSSVSKRLKKDFPCLLACISSTFKAKKVIL